MRTVYVLQHEDEFSGRDDVKFIGVYETRLDAEAAVSRLKIQPGFRDWPEGFHIDEYLLGQDNWTEGFSILVPIHVEVVGDQGRFECLQAEWMPGDVYRLIKGEGDPPSDRLAFKYGQKVRCEERALNGSPGCLVAVEIAG